MSACCRKYQNRVTPILKVRSYMLSSPQSSVVLPHPTPVHPTPLAEPRSETWKCKWCETNSMYTVTLSMLVFNGMQFSLYCSAVREIWSDQSRARTGLSQHESPFLPTLTTALTLGEGWRGLAVGLGNWVLGRWLPDSLWICALLCAYLRRWRIIFIFRAIFMPTVPRQTDLKFK